MNGGRSRDELPLALRLAVQLFLVVLAAAAIYWAISVFPSALPEGELQRVARRIIAGERYKIEPLDRLVSGADAADADCRPVTRHSVAIIRLRIVEEAIAAADRPQLDDRLDQLIAATRRSLACAPADPYLWMILFWVESTRHGFDPKYFDYLRLSYRLGPNEGWIAAKRNRLAFVLFEQLPDDLRMAALDEFPRLVSPGFVGEAISIFTGPAWRYHDQLLPRLAAAPEAERIQFTRSLSRMGYDLKVPGVPQQPPRPWN